MINSVYNGSRNLERALENMSSKKISSKNKKLIEDFLSYLAANSVGKLRQEKYIYGLQHVAEWLEMDFDKATKTDIQRLVGFLENMEDFSDWTKHDYKVFIKKFYKWLRNHDIEDEDSWETPIEVKWIKAKKPRNAYKLKSAILTPKDIAFLEDFCRNLREKTLIRTLYETGCRIGEILNLKIKDVEFDDYGALLNINAEEPGKTGYRKIRVVDCASTIEQWLKQEHPDRNNKNAYLLCNINKGSEGEILTYANAKKILDKLKQRSGFKKPLNPHHFRHSRATELAEKMTDSQRCHYLGWRQGRQMARIYTHIEDTNRIILKLNRFVKKDVDEIGKKVKICPCCNINNPGYAKFCIQCSMGLDIKSVEEFERSKKRTLKTIDNVDTLMSMADTIRALNERLEKLEDDK